MAYIGSTEFYLNVAKGLVPGHSLVHKFGAGAVTTTLAPVSNLTKYETPTTAQALEVVSDSASDAVGGGGATKVTILGLDSSWNEVEQTITLTGTTPAALTTNLIRLYRWYVSESEAYATATTGSHVGNLTIQLSGGGTTWDTMTITPFATGQSQIGAYTIPTGYTGYLLAKTVFTDSSKTADVYFFQRPNADDVATPYSGAMRLVEREVGVSGGFKADFISPKSGIVGPADVGFMANVSSGTAEISVEFELLLVQN